MNNQSNRNGQVPGMNVADVIFVLFRHKWVILGCSALGLVAAALIYLLLPRMYTSEAKLYVRYVFDSRVPNGVGGETQVRQPDAGGANIINSEVEILKSLDLVSEVVSVISPQKILARAGGGNDPALAIKLVAKNLTVQALPQNDVLSVSFQHPDPTLVQAVLQQLIASYLKKHDQIHRGGGGVDELLTQQTDSLRSQLAQTEEELRAAKMKAGIVNLEDTKRAYTDQVSRIRQEILDTEAELAEQRAALSELLGTVPQDTETNEPAPASFAPPPPEKVTEYRNLLVRIDSLHQREQILVTQFTEESLLVKAMHDQLTKVEKMKKALEKEYPGLVTVEPTTSGGRGANPAVEITAAKARIAALDAKLKTLNGQMEKVLADISHLNEVEPALTHLQMKRELQETQYRYFSTSLDQARFNDALGAGRLSNISIAQAPSPPMKESRKLVKLLAGIAAAGVGLGLGLAFLLELYLDSTVKRPSELETKLHLPVMLALPDARWQRSQRQIAFSPPEPPTDGTPVTSDLPLALRPSATARDLWAFYEGLRERLMTYFETRNILKKPKLVAVTGCNRGAGTSSIAAGLASTLSETGDGNVLLVDMTVGRGEAYPFRRGKLTCDLAGALEEQGRENAKVQENLYVVSEAPRGDRLPAVLPKRFTHLVPKLKASDYDYIIFDMPPVSPISITPRLAQFMDMVLLVVESEKTKRDSVKRAASLLAESKATVSAVFNKVRRHVPECLDEGVLPE